MLNKKGQIEEAQSEESTEIIFAANRSILIILGFFVLLFLAVIYGFIDRGDFFEKKLAVTETGLTIDILPLYKGNVQLFYLRNDSYAVNISEGIVKVFDDDGAQEYETVNDGALNYGHAQFKSRTIGFAKEGNNVRFGNDSLSFNPFIIACDNVPHDYLTSITLDSGHGGVDTGFVSQNTIESEITRDIALRLNAFSAAFSPSLDLTKNIFVPVQDRDVTGKSILSLHVGNEEKTIVKAFIPVNDRLEESRFFACNILNSVSSKLIERGVRLRGVAIIPVNENNLAETEDNQDPLSIIIGDKVAVLLEIGSVKNMQDLDVQSLSEAIYDGVSEYGIQEITA